LPGVQNETDAIVVGGGLAGLVATAGRRVTLVEQEPEVSLGGARRYLADRITRVAAPHRCSIPMPAR
jgi:predicted oxidoreductase